MDDKKIEAIAKEAKEILASFSKSLSKVKFKEKKMVSNDSGMREEGEGMKSESDFRERMFENAPNKNENSIIAEKKSW